MVTFSCGTCNESLKKQKVEQHYYRCRNDYVTCIDCNADFYGDDYNSHVKCVSEAERYGGANYKGKANKGEAKQNSWIDSIQQAMENSKLSGGAKRVLDVIGANENIPRKKKKFDNFVKNTCRFARPADIDEVWEAINVKKPEVKPEVKKQPEQTEIKAEVKSTEEVNNNKRKSVEETETSNKKAKIDWKWSRVIKETLREMENSSCKIKSLRKQVFKKAQENGIEILEKEEFLAKVKKVKKIVVDDDKNIVSIPSS